MAWGCKVETLSGFGVLRLVEDDTAALRSLAGLSFRLRFGVLELCQFVFPLGGLVCAVRFFLPLHQKFESFL